jgi:glycerol-3-phosphate dehydrogenase
MDRDKNLQCVSERSGPWDVVVIGGGATGAGCALDGASRGYSVLLLEQHDFGKGTSSRSTKLLHGGVRYLRQGDVSLVREALRERAILLKNAPHVAHALDFIIPCYSVWETLYYGAGMKIYDVLAGSQGIGRSRILSRREALDRLGNLDDSALTGGVLYQDGQFDDARMLIDILRTAESKGAAVLNYSRVTSLIKDKNGIINGVEFEDVENGDLYSVSATAVINATGAFCPAVQKMSDANLESAVTYSRGVHLVFDGKFLPLQTALMIPKTSDGRVLFCIPWNGHVLMGTTDTPVETAELEPHAMDAEVEFILETASEYLAAKPTREDILSIYAGIRPLVKTGATTKTSALSRGHHLFVDTAGLITITGGKWTTYRRMAEDAVNKAAKVAGLEERRCVTADLPIKPPATLDKTEPLHPDFPYTDGDVIRAVRDEMARTIEDVLARRTRVLFLDAKAAIKLAARVGELMAKELDKDDAWVAEQIVNFRTIAENYSPTLSSSTNRSHSL